MLPANLKMRLNLVPMCRQICLFPEKMLYLLLQLLICTSGQNNDDRSALLSPYKTYDYINLRKPILGLLRNPELHQLLNTSSNYLADCGSISDIKSSLKKLYIDYSYSPTFIKPSQYIIDSSDQTSKFLQLNF